MIQIVRHDQFFSVELPGSTQVSRKIVAKQEKRLPDPKKICSHRDHVKTPITNGFTLLPQWFDRWRRDVKDRV
jgi:hypothetical protein